MATTKMSVKLLIQKSRRRVLVAEAGKDFVDFIFGLMALPLTSVINLLKEHQMVGCIGNLYQSVENLNETYLESVQNKKLLLNPRYDFPPNDSGSPLLLQNPPTESASTYYTCYGTSFSGYHSSLYLSDVSGATCKNCNRQMNTPCSFLDSKSPNSATFDSGGFVKGVVTYTITDDLTVTPMSSISNILLLNKFQVTHLSDLEEKTVNVGMVEALAILLASLKSKTVLTDAFIG
ncbi:hypothetical protein H6P81_006583 [Aristolochia fimbriata]|uniref:DUF674 domain-containing protein n=1 Tax=Aristolochia fimbriata TaxID=158543 RepID=A0AAV7EYV9_ARIFI|nr:hypothetical protein H6P81_006583 [Aristolochia fimbriata]